MLGFDRLTVNWVPGGGWTFRSDFLEMLGTEHREIIRLILPCGVLYVEGGERGRVLVS